MTLRQKQSKFAGMVGLLLHYAYGIGYEVTFGDAWAHDRHKKGSLHYKRLAIDLNLFIRGRYQRSTKAHLPLGMFWESLDPECSWGGRWEDGNHYSYGE
jgi:hypothetical protein